MQTRSQRWSKVAWERVSASAGALKEEERKKYRTSCRKMPGLLHQAGALQAVVFQVARDEQGRRYINDLCAALELDTRGKKNGYEALIEHLQGAPTSTYMARTDELAQIATWFSRFAQVLIPESGSTERSDG